MNILDKTVGAAFKSTTAMTASMVGATQKMANTTVSATGKLSSLTASATKSVASTTLSATVGTVTNSVGLVAGLTSATMNVTKTTALGLGKMTMINRRGKYSGGRRLKRQNSRLAWESRVTAPYIKLDLILECQNLPKKSTFGQADGFAVVWEIPSGQRHITKKISKLPARHEKEVGRTEVQRENPSPKFTSSFRLEYKFQEEQYYIVRVYNEDLQYSSDLKEHDFVGGCIFSLGDLMGAGGCSIARPLTSNPKDKCFLILVGQEIIETREVLEFRFSGQNLGSLEKKRNKVQMAKDVLDTLQHVNVTNVLEKYDLYFRIEKLNHEDQSWKVVWKSEVVKDSQNPTWCAARIPLQLLCDDDPETQVKVTIWDWNRFSPDELVGFIETSVNDLTHRAKRGIPVYNVSVEKKRLLRGPKLKKAGILKVLKSSIIQIPSMLQYISGGCQMDLIFAVDCTSSNGDWRDENSQHYHSSTWLNDYQAAIHKIATVYQGFEGKKDYGLWGFGAIIDEEIPLNSFFSMGENLTDADKLVEAYDKVFSDDNKSLQLGRSGCMKPVIQAAMYRANKKNQISQCYTTLVILTTGEISDIVDSIDVVCTAAEDSPLSIVIIGVGGGGDFQFIDLLTGAGDEACKLRHSNGVPIARELVNFVSFHEFNGNASQVVVEALRDVPEQFVQYFLNAGIPPMPPKALPDFTSLDANGKPKRPPSSSNKNVNKKKSSKKMKRNDNDDDVSDLEEDDL